MMPKRIIDGDALWRSHKLSLVQPVSFRAEFANLIPLALANGVFEADPDLIWATAYAYNRPDVSRENVAAILAEFEHVGLLLRWVDVNGIPKALNGIPNEGKVWGYWIGIEKPGRLPGQSRQGKNERVGPTPPQSMDSIKQPMDSKEKPTGTDLSLGFGSGIGSGSGLGGGNGKPPSPQYSQDDFDERDMRLVAKSRRKLDERLKSRIGGESMTNGEYFGIIAEETGLAVKRILELDKKQKEWPAVTA